MSCVSLAPTGSQALSLPTLLHCQVIQAIWGSNWMNKPIALQSSRSKVIDSSGKSCTRKHEDKLLRNMEGWWKEHLHFKRGDPSFNSDPCASAAPPFFFGPRNIWTTQIAAFPTSAILKDSLCLWTILTGSIFIKAPCAFCLLCNLRQNKSLHSPN